MPREDGPGDVQGELRAQGLREELQELHLALLDLLPLLPQPVLYAMQDADNEVHWEVVRTEVAAQDGVVRGGAAVEPPQLRHGRCDAAHEGGKGDHGEEQDQDREDALGRVASCHLHPGGRELRERPVESREVLEHHGGILQAVVVRPSAAVLGLGQVRAEGPPAAGDEVVQPHDGGDELHNRQDDVVVLGQDVVGELLRDPVEPGESQEAKRAQNSQDANALAHPPEQESIVLRTHPHLKPRGDQHEGVDEEPRAQVAARDLAQPDLNVSVRVEPGEEGEGQVYRPEDEEGPEEHAGAEAFGVEG
mmetsp:Transcript_48814/g.98429  ORF Transcript_48814/g.98429 Transcript_48814/m.98429 type:complete len:306 (+) Transcript_48814:625-1542(+)